MLPTSPDWRTATEALLEAQRGEKTTDSFIQSSFRRQFFPIISGVYFDEVKTFANLDLETIKSELKLTKGTESRWYSGHSAPGPDKFFAVVLLMLKLDLNSIPFPGRNVMLFRSVRGQIERFSEDYCVRPSTGFNLILFRAMIHAMSHPSADKLVPGDRWTQVIREKNLTESVKRVNTGLKDDHEAYRRKGLTVFPKPPVVDPQTLSSWYSNWGIPYTLFAMGTKDANWGIEDV